VALQLEGFTFTATEAEAAAIYCLVSAEGFTPDSKGVKAFLLHKAGVGETPEPPEPDAQGSPEDDLSGKMGRILEVLERNPEVTDYAIKKGAQVIGSLLKKLR
jgi:hypothetical protein